MAVVAQKMTPPQVAFDVNRAMEIWGRKRRVSFETLGPTRYEFGLVDEESRTRLLLEVNVGRDPTVDFRLSHIQGLSSQKAEHRLLGCGTLSGITDITYNEANGYVRFASSAGMELQVQDDRTFAVTQFDDK